jgi:gluconolactonase
MPTKPELIAEELSMPEGPVWCADGTLVVTAVAEGALYRIAPSERGKVKIADTAGGANGAALASDGGFVVTQNGGIDWSAMKAPASAGTPSRPYPAPRYVSPGLQRVAPDGSVSRLLEGMQAPNDLVIGPDGTIYFTDPHKFPAPPNSSLARVMALSRTGGLRVVADQFRFCNGIALEAGGTLVVTEANGLMRVSLQGEKEWIIENLSRQHATDGLAIDTDGRFYLAASLDHGVRIIDDGREVGFLPLPGLGATTNVCFGGPELRWLFATDGLPGNVWWWRDMPTPGLPLHPWPVPPAAAAAGTRPA